LEADGAALGSLRATHIRSAGLPSRSTTRLLALAADQLGLAVRRDDLRRQAIELEIARQADGLKSALLDAVSHDLRTPLASIRATAGSLADPDVPLDDATTRAAAAAIDLETQRLDRIVRGVLDLSRIEAGELRPDLEALDLRDVIEPVVDRLRPLLGERPVRIDVPDDLPPVRADAVLVDGLLANLLENAARYAPPPAAVVVSARRVDGTVEVAIEDAGPGVPAASIGRLFDKFHRVQQPGDGSRPGLGIGLAVVRGMVEAMGGTVIADTSPLGGLRVVVHLPAATVPAEPAR
jgi:two-component system sensor histidine kinase KdpD